MTFRDQPIQRKLQRVILLTSTAVLLLTGVAFMTYEWIAFRQEMVRNLSTLGEITALNSTAVLAFDNVEDAREVLSALRVEKHVGLAALYDSKGNLFATYPPHQPASDFSAAPQERGPVFTQSHLSLFRPVIENEKRLGSLYLESDLSALYQKVRLYAGIVLLVMASSWGVAFVIAAALQKRISQPILALANTAKAVSDRKDYSVRAPKLGEDELGLLTNAFNQMLDQIQQQDSALRDSEGRILRLNSALEQRVSERTAQLEAANKELEAFSYSVSHDLRAPLRGIAGFAQLLVKTYEGKLDREADRWLAIIQDETQRMGRLIDALLNFSRLGRQPMTTLPVDMTALVQSVFRELTAQSESKPQLVLPTLLGARGDEALLRQVFINLISNAIKFTRQQKDPRIEVGSRSEAEETLYYVKDNGVGFDPKYAQKLFGVFQRLHHEDEFEGTGVGLALVQRILQRHGGRIWAEAEPNQGATFYFTLPRKKDQAHES